MATRSPSALLDLSGRLRRGARGRGLEWLVIVFLLAVEAFAAGAPTAGESGTEGESGALP